MTRLTVPLISSLLLTGCLDLGGGGGGSSSAKPTPDASTPPAASQPDTQPPAAGTPTTTPPATQPDAPGSVTAPPQNVPSTPQPRQFPEPDLDNDEPIDAVAFYDVLEDGSTRPIRNDLTGTFPAMVQFVQSHSVDPKGNEEKNMPRLAMEREALLLVMPDPALGVLQKITLNATMNGQPIAPIELRRPNQLPRSDYSATDGRPDLVYSHRAWSAVLPWDQVKPGLALSFTDNKGRNGQLAANDIDFAAPAELVLHTIRLGMLTAPENSASHYFSQFPAEAATDYFQTIPIARMVSAQYDDVQFDRTMVATGVIYTDSSAVEGGVYGGDMRENVGKSTVSVGINLANYGITSSSMNAQNQPQLFQSVVAHHSRGKYTNGVVSHGLSGGNGMLTLWTSSGNEFSHEIGHHFGLGHYPGQSLPPKEYFWSTHHADSGWGYMAHRKRMRANVHWRAGVNSMNLGGWNHTFQNIYAYTADAMAGGAFHSDYSRYTHYTGYSTKIGIQPRLNIAIPSSTSSTGYLKWNPTTRSMEEHHQDIGNPAQYWTNGGDKGKFHKPRYIGVPVFTILGGYVPSQGKALLYPALRSNWGNVFNLPGPIDDATTRQCWLNVNYADGSSKRIAVNGNDVNSTSHPANKLHIQLAQSDKPLDASLYCKEPGATATELAKVEIPQNLPEMAAPVIVGKEAGFSALRKIEMPLYRDALLAQASKPVISLSGRAALLHESYSDNPVGLDAEASAVLARYQEQEQRAKRLNAWMNAYRTDLEQGDDEATQALFAFLEKINLRSDPLLPQAAPLRVNNHCTKVETVDGVMRPYILDKSLCTNANDELWVHDASMRLRPAVDLSLCLTSNGGGATTLTQCDLKRDAQVWEATSSGQYKRGSQCLDLNRGYLTDNRGTSIVYGCSGGGNQRWTQPTQSTDNLLLLLASSNNMPILTRLASNANATE